MAHRARPKASRVRQFLTPPVFEGDEEKTRTAALLNVMLLTTLAATVFGSAAIAVVEHTEILMNVLNGVVLTAGLLWLRRLMRRGHIRASSTLLLFVLWLSVTVLMVTGGRGMASSTVSGYFLIVIMAALLLDNRGLYVFTALSVLAIAGLLFWEVRTVSSDPGFLQHRIIDFIVLLVTLIATMLLLRFALHSISEGLRRAKQNEQSLGESNRELESRTNRLERLADQLKAAAQMSRTAAFATDLDTLLSQITHMVSNLFSYYHVGVFLIDEEGTYAVLQAANSEGGQKMLERGHRLRVGEQGVVGYVTSSGEPRIALDVGADAVYFDNPLLPRTRSEMALPFKLGDRVIGALDVQSEVEAAFDDDSIMVLQMIADQLAVTIENARLLSATQQAVRDLSTAAAEILAAATQQAASANQQSAAISQTTTTVDEVKVIAEQSVERTQEVVETSRRTVEVSRSGQTAVQESVDSVAQIKGRVESIAETILTLADQTRKIGEIIATVDNLAAQSNILALNAAIEAARAGEHGKGFTIVATEVRNLARQSRQATEQVRAILAHIQDAIAATVTATEEGSQAALQGLTLTAQTGEAIEQLAEVINESAQAAMQMMAGGRQQATGVEQIAIAMQNIAQSTVQNLSSTRQTEKAAQDLNDLATRLTGIVNQYRLQESAKL